ncbi:hypothetical protein FQN60_009164 [Etheostoma spectabile]|uniref:Uncharacterized protein n=1 Tax=Etheostoma spectabile TaxID=54343 RepID=A0A5J5C9X4_9PERO|nr:hypothetical protein FQN60_009164 [Etheostoma spectabile]
MDRNQYLTEANRQLSNTEHYQPIQSGIQPQTQAQLRNIIQTLYNKKFITAKQRDHLLDQTNHALDTSTFYPKSIKIHTPGPFPNQDYVPPSPTMTPSITTCLSPNPNQDVYPNPNPKTTPRPNLTQPQPPT